MHDAHDATTVRSRIACVCRGMREAGVSFPGYLILIIIHGQKKPQISHVELAKVEDYPGADTRCVKKRYMCIAEISGKKSASRDYAGRRYIRNKTLIRGYF